MTDSGTTDEAHLISGGVNGPNYPNTQQPHRAINLDPNQSDPHFAPGCSDEDHLMREPLGTLIPNPLVNIALSSTPNSPKGLDIPQGPCLALQVTGGKPDPSYVDACFRKVGFGLIPIFLVLNFLNYLDRTNLAFAAISMSRDLQLTKEQYGLGSSLFFVGYCIFQIPSQVMLERVGAPKWLAIIVTLWGLVALSMSGLVSAGQLYASRIILGAAEAGSFPGMWFFFTLFYPDARVTYTFALLETSIMVAQVRVLLIRLSQSCTL